MKRAEKDKEKLKKLYGQGYRDAASCYKELSAFLEKQGPGAAQAGRGENLLWEGLAPSCHGRIINN